MKRVLIVEEGQWGMVKPEDYQALIKMYFDILNTAKEPYGSEGRCVGYRKVAKVGIVATAARSEEIIKSAPINDSITAVVFISRGMEKEAERIAKAYPKVRVIVFTGLIPEGKVIWVKKATVDIETVRKIVLYP